MRYLSTASHITSPRLSKPFTGLALALAATIFPNSPLQAQTVSTAPANLVTPLLALSAPNISAAQNMALRYLALSATFLHDREFMSQNVLATADENGARLVSPTSQSQKPAQTLAWWRVETPRNATWVRSLASFHPQMGATSNANAANSAVASNVTTPQRLLANNQPRLSRPVLAHTSSAISAPQLEARNGSTAAFTSNRNTRLARTHSKNTQRVATPEATARPLRLASRALTPPMLDNRTSAREINGANNVAANNVAANVAATTTLPTVNIDIAPKTQTNAPKNVLPQTVAPKNATPKTLPRVAALPRAVKPDVVSPIERQPTLRQEAQKQARNEVSDKQRERDRILLAQLDKDLMRAKRGLKSARADLDEGARELGAFTNALQSAMLEAGPDAEGLHPFVRTAQRYAGTPYVWGGGSARGFDCSGFIIRVMRDLGYRALPHSAAEQFNYGTPVAKSLLKPGDLVFFANTYKPGISHVGIWLGRGRFIHAAGTGKGTIVSYLSASPYSEKYAGARRLIAKR